MLGDKGRSHQAASIISPGYRHFVHLDYAIRRSLQSRARGLLTAVAERHKIKDVLATNGGKQKLLMARFARAVSQT